MLVDLCWRKQTFSNLHWFSKPSKPHHWSFLLSESWRILRETQLKLSEGRAYSTIHWVYHHVFHLRIPSYHSDIITPLRLPFWGNQPHPSANSWAAAGLIRFWSVCRNWRRASLTSDKRNMWIQPIRMGLMMMMMMMMMMMVVMVMVMGMILTPFMRQLQQSRIVLAAGPSFCWASHHGQIRQNSSSTAWLRNMGGS